MSEIIGIHGNDILKIKPVQYLIRGVVPSGCLVLVAGHSGAGKTFVMVDWSLSIMSGRSWLGRYPVERGPVVYVAAESVPSYALRLKAWTGAYGVADMDNLDTVTTQINLRDPAAVAQLIEYIRTRMYTRFDGMAPKAIVFDTLAACTLPFGISEGSATHAGQIVAGCRTLQDAFGATVVLVDHLDKGGKGRRGHGAVGAAAEVRYTVSESEDHQKIILTCPNARCMPKPDRVIMSRVEVDMQDEECLSAVLAYCEDSPEDSKARNRLMLRALADLTTGPNAPYPGGATAGAWSRTAGDVGISKASFYRYSAQLLAAGKVEATGNPHEKNRRYHLAKKGAKSA